MESFFDEGCLARLMSKAAAPAMYHDADLPNLVNAHFGCGPRVKDFIYNLYVARIR